MIGLKTIRRGERVAIWSPSGDVRFVDGPKRLFLWRDTVEPVKRFRAEPHQYFVVRHLDGRTEHRCGRAESGRTRPSTSRSAPGNWRRSTRTKRCWTTAACLTRWAASKQSTKSRWSG